MTTLNLYSADVMDFYFETKTKINTSGHDRRFFMFYIVVLFTWVVYLWKKN